MTTRKSKTPDDMVKGTVHSTVKGDGLEVITYVNKSKVVVQFIGYGEQVTASSGSIRTVL